MTPMSIITTIIFLAGTAIFHQIESIPLPGDRFQDDMVLDDLQNRAALGLLQRTGLIDTLYRWPNATLPYTIADGYFNAAQIEHLEYGLRIISNVSCIRFVHRTNEENYVEVTGKSDEGCWSYVGNANRGKQELNLVITDAGVGCFRFNPTDVVHEFLHALGFYHMQSASDRDDFVTIAWQHIAEGQEENFIKFDADVISHFGIEYDIRSIMHYGAYAYSKNGFATVIPHNITLLREMGIGQNGGLTDNDVNRLNAMYNCDVNLQGK